MIPNDDLRLDNDWLEAELQDTLDEDYEIELEDALLSLENQENLPGKASGHVASEGLLY